jgi:hypothetical protein
LKLLDELATVALADGSSCPDEIVVLLECARALKLDTNMTAPVLASTRAMATEVPPVATGVPIPAFP